MTDNTTNDMTKQSENSLEKSPLLVRLEEYGNPRKSREWESGREDYVAKLGLTAGDVPELLAIAKKWVEPQDAWPDDENYIAGYAPIHAWRCLAQLRTEESIPVFLDMLDPLADDHDDWSHGEFPRAFAWIGPASLTPLRDYLADDTHRNISRMVVAHGLQKLAVKYPQVADEVVKSLTNALSRYQETDEAINGSLIACLLDLKQAGLVAANEIAEGIERALAADCVDTMCCGNWNTVRNQLGVEGLGLVSEELANHSPTARFSPELDAFAKKLQQYAEMYAQKQAQEQARIDAEKWAALTAPVLPDDTYASDRPVTTTSRAAGKIGRNDPCSCGSGKKYKKCCAE